MTPKEYQGKRSEMFSLASELNKSDEQKYKLHELIAEVSLYEANNGLVDINEFNKKL